MSATNPSAVNERTSAKLTIAWFDADGEPAVPSSVSYRIDCLTTGQAVRASTAATPAAETVIQLTSDDNAMRSATNQVETRLVTVSAVYGAGDELHIEHAYELRNLRFVAAA